ncbi:site-specific DNA-methyltransferase [Bifidobacterium boum]|nr:site-specific DNA-methyltransferase [Bifidobacterium boum]
MGEVIGKEGEDFSRHDKWPCMIYPTLQLLRRMMSHSGAIFISIDGNEHTVLEMICDEIFDIHNRLATFIWRKIDSPNNNHVVIAPDHEYILDYAHSPADLTRRMEASEQDETKQSPVDALADMCMGTYKETRHDWEEAARNGCQPDQELRETWRLAQGLRFAATQYRPFIQGGGRDEEKHHHLLGCAPRTPASGRGTRNLVRRQHRRIRRRVAWWLPAALATHGNISRPARRGLDLQLCDGDLLPMPVQQHHPTLPHLPQRTARHSPALFPGRVR